MGSLFWLRYFSKKTQGFLVHTKTQAQQRVMRPKSIFHSQFVSIFKRFALAQFRLYKNHSILRFYLVLVPTHSKSNTFVPRSLQTQRPSVVAVRRGGVAAATDGAVWAAPGGSVDGLVDPFDRLVRTPKLVKHRLHKHVPTTVQVLGTVGLSTLVGIHLVNTRNTFYCVQFDTILFVN